MGLRGILHLSLRLQGPGHDLHSGAHGGAVANPATEICRLLARLHNDTGQVAVKGFYDNVREPSSQEKELANAGFNESEYVSETGIQPLAGEQNYSPAERIGMRPCIDVNGVSAGYSGPGIKTVIPDHAEAKVSARLVPDQDPGRCTRLIMDHLREHTPPGMELTVPEHISAGGALRIDPNSEYVSMAQHVLESLTGRETAFRWEGASVPIVAALAETSGAEPLLVGFGSQEDNVHAPNESFSLDRFKQGFMYIGSIIRSAAEKNA
jgi:acetylornithine deacetylase/succinyl-diaminopimelate desuccinylase-like protein